MFVGSLFSGIGGLDLGLERAGMEIVFQVEIDRQAQRVLRRHWPDAVLYSDVREVTRERLVADLGPERAAIAVLVGGWPCQDISLAGSRAGLAGERSGLFYEFARVARETGARWLLAENVAGLLSSYSPTVDAFGDVPPGQDEWEVEETYDLGAVITTLAELGYVGAWRAANSRGFGVPQQRRRIFLVGHLGEPWTAPGEVLFESEIVPRDLAASDEASEEPACDLGGGAPAGGDQGRRDHGDAGEAATLLQELDRVPQGLANQLDPIECAGTIGSVPAASGHRVDVETSGAYVVERPFVVGDRFGNDAARTLTAPANGQHNDLDTENFVVDTVYRKTQRAREVDGGEKWEEATHANTLNVFDDRTDERATHLVVDEDLIVRRLTPLEYERLQGFPDRWTELADDGKKMSDSARYRLVGNSVSVPVAEWIGRRIAEVDRAR